MKILFLELNEFNDHLLNEAGSELGLKNIQKLTSFHKSETWTEDQYESDYLEPWVQWVSVHTGIPSSEHRVKHLSDGRETSSPQLWEKLSEMGISSGIWGAMNASRRGAPHCRFFLPDPWTSSEKAFPEELNALLSPLQNTSKNYTSRPKREYLKDLIHFLKLFKVNGLLGHFGKGTAAVLKNAIRYRFLPFVFISFADELSTSLFLKYKELYKPDFSLLFLNSIAHLQHHQWRNRKISKKDPLAHGFRAIDRILGKIYAQMKPEDLLIVTNALSQKNTVEETPWILYRQIDHTKFLEAIGIHQVTVHSHMTHDAHLLFPDEGAARRGAEILKQVRIEEAPLFIVEVYPEDPKKLFYRIQFTDEVGPEARFVSEGRSYRWFDWFTSIVRRTGKHTQTGTLFCNRACFPHRLANHEIYKNILAFFSN